MDSTTKKYGEILDTLDEWRINHSDLQKVIRGERTLNQQGVIAWSHLAVAFNREVYPLIVEKTRATTGMKVVITESDPAKRLELLRRSLLYTDTSVVFSGGEPTHDYGVLLEGVRKGAIVCDQIPEFFDDLLMLRPILNSGLGLCIQRHFFDATPNQSKTAWLLTNLKRDKSSASHTASLAPLNPYSVYTEFFRPAGLDCIYLGSDYSRWKDRLTTSLKSPQELAFATILNLQLPYLSNLSLEVLTELRISQPELFSRARRAIQEAVKECLKFDGAVTEVGEFARHIQKSYLEAAENEATEDIKIATTKKYIRRCSPVISTLSFAFNALLGNPVGLILDLLNIGQQGTSEFLESRSEKLRKSGNDLYLFSKLEEVHNEITAKKT